VDASAVIDEGRTWEELLRARGAPAARVRDVLQKAEQAEGLSSAEAAVLLQVDDPDLIEEALAAAGRVKRAVYGERLVFFAPLYLSSHCVNDCEYCGFRVRNPAPRRRLTAAEVGDEARALIAMGHRRLLVECGEHPVESPIDYVVEAIGAIYGAGSPTARIRRVNVNVAAATVDDYRALAGAGIGTYQLFQETYHRETYARLHRGPKASYERQLLAHDRAMAAGIEDVGLGVLYGLFDHRFDTLALIAHAAHLERTFGVGPHTLSVPRLQPAPTVDLAAAWPVSEPELLRLIAVLRLAVPYAGLIISTRERPEVRARAFQVGVTQTSAGSRTAPGGYACADAPVRQFSTQDERPLAEVVESALAQGELPSFCTACYRVGRTGARIMQLIKGGTIHLLCTPNALLAFKEYLEDAAPEPLRRRGEAAIAARLGGLPAGLRRRTRAALDRIEAGERDLFF
jgi:2-iminoacetate synthase